MAKIKNIISGSKKQTTNNRMELIASIEALKLIKTKSKKSIYLLIVNTLDGIKVWIKNWKSNNWRTKTNKDVKNLDLWKELDDLHSFHSVQWTWVKGHSGDRYNDEVDSLARDEAEKILIFSNKTSALLFSKLDRSRQTFL